jgi:hypothetical protein
VCVLDQQSPVRTIATHHVDVHDVDVVSMKAVVGDRRRRGAAVSCVRGASGRRQRAREREESCAGSQPRAHEVSEVRQVVRFDSWPTYWRHSVGVRFRRTIEQIRVRHAWSVFSLGTK